MEKYNDLRPELENMGTQHLEQMLRAETEKEIPDDDLVLLILHILKERDADKLIELSQREETAWKLYQKRVTARARKPVPRIGWIVRAASLILIIGLLFVGLPQQVEAESFWELLVRWTSDIVEFFSPRDNEGRITEYEFKTDNPGLQQIYDTVVEMGVTVPVVPMWLPADSELVELQKEDFPAKAYLHARFKSDVGEIIYNVDVYHADVLHEYQKDETGVTEYERGGVCHYIMKNNGKMVAVWIKDNVECSLSLCCQEDVLKHILRTIYDLEDG